MNQQTIGLWTTIYLDDVKANNAVDAPLVHRLYDIAVDVMMERSGVSMATLRLLRIEGPTRSEPESGSRLRAVSSRS